MIAKIAKIAMIAAIALDAIAAIIAIFAGIAFIVIFAIIAGIAIFATVAMTAILAGIAAIAMLAIAAIPAPGAKIYWNENCVRKKQNNSRKKNRSAQINEKNFLKNNFKKACFVLIYSVHLYYNKLNYENTNF
jgi:membrane protein implicated in regulation of membrane protease activity